MPKLHLEPLVFCFAWAALAVSGWLFGGIWAGSLLSLGLVAVLMPVSATIIAKTEDVSIERQVRWGILAIAGLAFAIWLNLQSSSSS